MSFFMPPWESNQEPNQGNVRMWLDNLYTKMQPGEQIRWNEANINSLFYAGAQNFVNRMYGNNVNQASTNQLYFNISQQPINMVSGFQRQHRKSINYIPSEGADPHTTDQYTRIIDHVANIQGINEAFSKSCELAAVAGLNLLQPYLDYTGDDPAQGELKVKVWEYNSFMCDQYAREPDFSDSNIIWCQEYISRREAESRFLDKADKIHPMAGSPQPYGSFYFLPENYNMNRKDLMIISYVWYKWNRDKKRLYSPSRNQFFDFGGGQEQLNEILYHIQDLEEVTVKTPTWKLATVLNDQLVFQGVNPLGFDECPFIPTFWNYEAHISQPQLRDRSLMTTMRSSQFLMNRRILLNHDISESSINTGWMRKIGAVSNEDNLKKSGQGWDIIINEGYELTDIQKIIPNAVPPSDMALADQLQNLIFATSGVNVENWSAQEQGQVSALTVLLKQGANLMVLQKYFDQWDFSLKILGDRLLRIVMNNWNAAKVSLILGEEPSPHFYSKIFAKYQVIVEEGLNTATQRQQEYMQWLELNQALGGIIPASEIAKRATIQGKNELMQILAQQEQQQEAVAEHTQNVQHVLEEAKIKELYSKSANNLAMARERHGREQSNIGLFEERLSEITNNRSMALKNKMDALAKMMEVIQKYGEIETALKANNLQSYEFQQEENEDREKLDAKQTSQGNEFVMQMLQNVGKMQPNQGEQQSQGQEQQQMQQV